MEAGPLMAWNPLFSDAGTAGALKDAAQVVSCGLGPGVGGEGGRALSEGSIVRKNASSSWGPENGEFWEYSEARRDQKEPLCAS